MGVAARTDNPSEIVPDHLYALAGFITSSGISYSKIQQAKRHGIILRTLKTGRRVFVRGTDGIAFIRRLAEEDRQNAAHRSKDSKQKGPPRCERERAEARI